MRRDTTPRTQGVSVALLRTSIAKFLTCSVLVLSGCGGTASTCEPSAEHDHPDEEEEECAPGSNCMCANGMTGTKVCDVMTEAFVMCDCSKSSPAGAAGQSGATTPTGTTSSGVTGAAGASAAGAAGAATGAAGAAAATSSAAGASAAGAAASSTASAGAAAAAGGGASTSSAAGASAAGQGGAAGR